MDAMGYILLMAEILHQLMGSLSHYFQGFIRPRWLGMGFLNHQQYHPRKLRYKSPPKKMMMKVLGDGFFAPFQLGPWGLHLGGQQQILDVPKKDL